MNKYESFLERNSIRLYKKIDEFYEIEEQLEYAIKSSICVDLTIFMIETLNQLNRQEITNSVINKLVDALGGVFPIRVFYKVQDFAYSREEAAAIITELYHDGDSPESLVNTNFDMKTLIGEMYNFRIKQYFSEDRDPIMVVSAIVPMMIRHAKIKDNNMELLHEIDKILSDCMSQIPKLVDDKNYAATGQFEKTKKSNCYIVTAASGSESSELVIFYREFRDDNLEKFVFGRTFIDYYYRKAPYFAGKIEKNALLKMLSWSMLVCLKSFIVMVKRIRSNNKRI